MEEENDGKINAMHAFWIFGLGMGIGAWLITSKLSDFLGGIFFGAFGWFFLLIIFGEPVMVISKWIKKKIN